MHLSAITRAALKIFNCWLEGLSRLYAAIAMHLTTHKNSETHIMSRVLIKRTFFTVHLFLFIFSLFYSCRMHIEGKTFSIIYAKFPYLHLCAIKFSRQPLVLSMTLDLNDPVAITLTHLSIFEKNLRDLTNKKPLSWYNSNNALGWKTDNCHVSLSEASIIPSRR